MTSEPSGKSVDTLLDSDISRFSAAPTNTPARAPAAPTYPVSTSTPPPNSIASRLDHACANLTPAWFTSTMGTGIVSILLYNFPYPADWLRYIGIAIFLVNVVLFTTLSVVSLSRYVRYRGVFTRTLTHPVAGMFWGALPMGFATIVNMVAYVCVPRWGGSWVHLAVGLWWIDAIVSVAVNIGMLIAMITRQSHSSESMSATWLLPIVSSVVAAASGGVVASSIAPYTPSLAHSITIVSFIIWGTGVPVACFIMALYIYRSAVHGVPPAGAIPSVLLPIGPCGQGSFGIVLLGRTVRELAWVYDTGLTVGSIGGEESMKMVADAVYAGCLITGLILWGLGLVWYILGFYVFLRHSLSIDRAYLSPRKFTLGLYATTFPIGVFATAAYIIAQELDSTAMRVIGCFLALQVTASWAYVAVCNVGAVLRGSVWAAPELAGVQVERRWTRDVKGVDVEKQ